MTDETSTSANTSMSQALHTIKQQEQEIASLQQQLQREQFAQELHKLLSELSATSIILSPFTYTRLLEMVVQVAARVIAARSGSLFLIDEQTNELVFEVAIGPSAQAVKTLRVPLGHGIAGMVALTGQPMAIANAQQDDRLAVDIASTVNYIPENVLCVPLFYEDRVIGALELLDKTTGSSFHADDMEILGQFANMAAIAIAQGRAYHDQQAILQALIRSFSEGDPEQKQRLYREAASFVAWTDSKDSINTKTRELAMLVHELLLYGEQECDMCISILQSFVTNARSRKKAYAIAGNW